MKNGFTLVELLAVLVILALVVLITIPVVTKTINSSKNETYEISVANYKRAVENALYQTDLVSTTVPDGIYKINSDGNICLSDDCTNILKVDTDGKRPTKGEVIIVNNEVMKYSNLFFDKFTAIINDDTNLVINDNLDKTCFLFNDINDKDVIEIGDEYICEVAPETYQTFYVLSIEGNNINLIMDSNINAAGEAVKSNDMTDKGFVAYSEDGSNQNGPVSAIAYLNTATSSWTKINNLNETYDDEAGVYTGFTLSGKARLIKLSEATVLCQSECPTWLIGNLSAVDDLDGLPALDLNLIPCGYWTMETDEAGNAAGGFGAAAIDSKGTIGYYAAHDANVYYDYQFGVRPVITVLSSDLG